MNDDAFSKECTVIDEINLDQRNVVVRIASVPGRPTRIEVVDDRPSGQYTIKIPRHVARRFADALGRAARGLLSEPAEGSTRPQRVAPLSPAQRGRGTAP